MYTVHVSSLEEFIEIPAPLQRRPSKRTGMAVQAVQSRDRELVLAITLITSLLSLVAYLIVDICYAAADPRVSFE